MRGLEGFRLFHAYVVVALAAAVVFARPSFARHGMVAILAIGLAVSAYAALRLVIGPAESEIALATTDDTTTRYGSEWRAFGSFSGAVGLTSYLGPLTLFSLVIGLLVRRVRVLAWTVALLCVAAVIGSYARAPLLGMVLGLACVLAVLLSIADMTLRRKLAALAAAAMLVAVAFGGIWAASQGSPQLRERAQGILDPLDDASVNVRLRNWENVIGEVRRRPLGRGVGTIGRASPVEYKYGTRYQTTDNSFLKVFVDQGIPVALIFLCGLLGVVAVMLRRLRRAVGEQRALGLAAVAGLVTFLGMAATGEYVEQPGKVVAWGLLGVALSQAFARPAAARSPAA
jgi:O-Antigen ligase